MKKISAKILSAAAISISAMSLFSFGAAADIIGDANGDGTFNAADADALCKYLTVQGDVANAAAADMNGDGRLNAVDLSLMKRALLAGTQNPPASGSNYVTQISFAASSVTLKNADGETVSPENAENVKVENGTYVTVTAQTTDGTTNFGDINLDGECADGKITVDVDETAYPNGQVTLNFNGLTLSNPNDSPIYIAQIADECVLTVKKDSVNTISDGTDYTNADGSAGAIYSLDDLKIKGKGSLTVNGNAGDGIVSKDDIKIWNGSLTVNAADDCIRGKDSIRIGDPDDIGTDGAFDTLKLTLTSKNGDGLKSTNDTADSGKGYIRINGGTVSIQAEQGDGIQAEQDIYLVGGDITVYTYQGSEAAASTGTSTGQTGQTNPWGGGMGGFQPGGGMGDESGHDLGLEFSCKGIKAGDADKSLMGNITIEGSRLNLNTSDDAVHCGGTLTISGGDITISTADDALHSDKYLHINGGTVQIAKCYEGIEAMQIYMTDGNITVYAEDDPMNASEKGVKNEVDVANDNCIVQIDGGILHAYVTNEREGDGVDSNGKIVINGGEIYVEGSVTGPDSALDSDGEMLVNGGVVMAIGGLGRGELPEQSSQQNSLYWGNSDTTYAAGSIIALVDAQGREILSYTSEQTFRCAVISTASIQTGGQYSITVNGTTVATFTVSAALMTQGDIGSAGGGGSHGDPGGRT